MQALLKSRLIARTLLVCFFGLSVSMPAVQASMIGTAEAVITAGSADRGYLLDVLQRGDVAAKLQTLGVSADDVQARVDAMSDHEVAELAAQVKELPAGGDALGALVFVFLVLLLTDILGFTNVFPFVKKTAR